MQCLTGELHMSMGCFTSCSELHQVLTASSGQTSSSKGGVLKQNCRLYRGSLLFYTTRKSPSRFESPLRQCFCNEEH